MDNPEKLETQYEEKHHTICVRHHYVQTNTNKVNSGAQVGFTNDKR